MSDFVYSVFIGIGIVIIALGVIAWLSLQRRNE